MSGTYRNDLNQIFAIEKENQKVLQLKEFDRSILIAGESLNGRDEIKSAIKEEFLFILQALNQQQVLKILKLYPIKVLVVTYELAYKTNSNLITQLKADPKLREIPIVVISPSEHRMAPLIDGADESLANPYTEVELLIKLRNLYRLRELRQNLDNELKSARKIQQALLPLDSQDLPGGQFEYLYHPCAELSGDFLDLVKYENGTLIYLADVTSHGIAAAQITYLVKILVKELAKSETDAKSPARVMHNVSRKIREFGLEFWVALQMVFFDIKKMELVLAQSLSPSPILFDNQGVRPIILKPTPTFSESEDSISLSDSELEAFNVTVSVNPGATFFMFTDGAFEFSSEQLPQGFGERRLQSLLVNSEGKNWRNSAIDGLQKAKGSSEFPDDLTICRLHIT